MKARLIGIALACLMAGTAAAQIVLPGGGSAGSIAVGSITGLGTGIATALGINVGSTGAPVTNGGALGTPSSGTGTNLTGVPVSTGISGLGTGIAAALADAPNATGGPVTAVAACQSWTPTDQSGASLTFTSVSAQYCQYGNLVFAYGTLTYPSTADGSNAKISLPVAVPNQPYARIVGSNINALANTGLETVINSSTAAVFNTGTGVATLNSAMSLKVINFILIYPAS